MRLLALLLCSFAATGQELDLAGTIGYGMASELRGTPVGVGSYGVSIGGPATSRHAFRFDYRYVDTPTRVRFTVHLVTASWLLQARARRARPYLRLGGGLSIQQFHPLTTTRPVPPMDRTTTAIAGIVGGGVTINLGKTLFLRPELESYFLRGPTLCVLPTIALGVRF